MFTGLVTAVGTVRYRRRAGERLEMEIACPWRDLVPGESIAVDGACLTVTDVPAGGFAVCVVGTSLARTRFGDDEMGRRVNLERALCVGDRLGGHLVQGHVDGLGRVARIVGTGEGRLMDIEVPPGVGAVSIPLGSITVDGVSLTVNAVPAPGVVQVSLIPHTLGETTLGDRSEGDTVHLEGDLIGKYVQSMVRLRSGAHPDAPPAGARDTEAGRES
jgi:riboflavin synthase